MARKPSAKKAKLIAEQSVAITEYAANALVAAEQLRIKRKPIEGLSIQDRNCPLDITSVQSYNYSGVSS